jgi:hypothetical protein
MSTTTCALHGPAEAVIMCSQIADAMRHHGRHLEISLYPFSEGDKTRTAAHLCCHCVESHNLPVPARPLTIDEWHRRFELKTNCSICFSDWVRGRERTTDPCRHLPVIVDYLHPWADMPGTAVAELIASDPARTRPWLAVEKPRCADCGHPLSTFELRNRIGKGGDLYDPRLQWPCRQLIRPNWRSEKNPAK